MLYRFEACEFQPTARRLVVDGVAHVIGGRAFDLLHALVENHHRVMTKDELYERVWPGLAVEPNNLQVQVWALRKVLGRHAIATVARRGYRFMLDVVREPAAHPSARTGLRRVEAPGADADAALVSRLASRLSEQRLVTLVGGDVEAGSRLALAAAQAVATERPGGVWQTEAVVLTGQRAPGQAMSVALDEAALSAATARLRGLLQRLGRRPTVLVVTRGQLAHGLRDAVQRLLLEQPRLHLLVNHSQALKLPGEKAVQGPASPGPQTTAASPGLASGHVRWRPRP